MSPFCAQNDQKKRATNRIPQKAADWEFIHHIPISRQMGYNFFHENTHPKSFYLKDSTLPCYNDNDLPASISQQYLETKRTNTELGSHDITAFDLQILIFLDCLRSLGRNPNSAASRHETPQYLWKYKRFPLD
jgi:hypothetical protein